MLAMTLLADHPKEAALGLGPGPALRPLGEGALRAPSRHNQGRGYGCYSFAAAGQAQSVGGGAGYADRRAAERLGEHLFGLVSPRRDPRPITDHLDRDV